LLSPPRTLPRSLSLPPVAAPDAEHWERGEKLITETETETETDTDAGADAGPDAESNPR
jgi:hypothetical protein